MDIPYTMLYSRHVGNELGAYEVFLRCLHVSSVLATAGILLLKISLRLWLISGEKVDIMIHAG